MSKTTVAIAFAALLLSGCGSVIRQEFLTNGTKDFDFRRPDCPPRPPAAPANAVAVRYLGSGGAAIAWRGDTILLGPYFSHAGSLITAQFGHVHFDQKRIAGGLADVDTANVRAIITGHSHFDHLGDVPVVAAEHTKNATIYTNDSGMKMLAAYPSLLARAKSVEGDEGKWIPIFRAIRIMPVRSEHAPQLCPWNHFPCTYAPGEVPDKWTAEWPGQRMRSLRGGKTFAYVIDLLGTSDEVRFRIYYNDSAAGPHLGIPPENIKAEHSYDLAILCMASYDHVSQYPETILASLQPRHVLVSHYDDFFRKQEGGVTFAPLLTNGKANQFMKRMRDALHHFSTVPALPATPVCGPMTAQWSMPVPQWPLYFVP